MQGGNRPFPPAGEKGFSPGTCKAAGAVLEDEKNVRFTSGDWFEVLRFFHFVL